MPRGRWKAEKRRKAGTVAEKRRKRQKRPPGRGVALRRGCGSPAAAPLPASSAGPGMIRSGLVWRPGGVAGGFFMPVVFLYHADIIDGVRGYFGPCSGSAVFRVFLDAARLALGRLPVR